MQFRAYNPERDRDAAHRIWRETGWLEKDKEAEMDRYVESGPALVAEINGEAECLVHTAPGTIRYLREDIPFTGVMGVTTSRIARKQGLALRLAARAVAEDAAAGAMVAGLGIFDQGYYNRIGFGNGCYEGWVDFDPAQLTVDVRPRVPCRLSANDWESIHAARLRRRRGHGACTFPAPEVVRNELGGENAFGLGYRDGAEGELTHYFWCRPKHPEHGPYWIRSLAFRTREQFLELMALLNGLADQVNLVSLSEPPGIQMQDLLARPLRQSQTTEGGKFACQHHALSCWQVRLCDMEDCLARTHLPWGEVRFHLELTDPIAERLDADAPWRGVAGDYVVTLGPQSGAERGTARALPTLRASVNAFTRLWLGVRPASGLAITDDLAGPPDLLETLDWVVRLPEPKRDWDF